MFLCSTQLLNLLVLITMIKNEGEKVVGIQYEIRKECTWNGTGRNATNRSEMKSYGSSFELM